MRLSHLEQRVADIRARFAAAFSDDQELAGFRLWTADEERHCGEILEAEKAALEAEADAGSCLPQFPAKLDGLQRLLKEIENGARAGVRGEEAFAIALEIEQSEMNRVYRDIVLMGRAPLRLMAREADGSVAAHRQQSSLAAAIRGFSKDDGLSRRAEAWAAALR